MVQFLAIKGVSETPHILTFLRKFIRDGGWKNFIYEWESILFSLFIAAFLSLLFYFGSRKKKLIPSGFQNFLEWVVESFQNIVVAVMGTEGRKYVPFLGTLFIYILSMNVLGLIPFMQSPSSNFNITLALAICVFGLVQYLNIKNKGIKGFFFYLAGSPKSKLGWIMAPLMFPIELITQISRPITLALRLFGNVLGEKILVGFFTVIAVTLLYFFPIQTPFMLFGLLISIMQAAVFTLLSAIYILLSLQHIKEDQQKNH